MSREYLPYLPGLTADQVILVEDDPQAPQGCRKPVRLGKPRGPADVVSIMFRVKNEWFKKACVLILTNIRHAHGIYI